MIQFDVFAHRLNGDESEYRRKKINHALRTLWLQKSLEEAYITYMDRAATRWYLFGKFGRKRAITSDLEGIDMPERRPVKYYNGWMRLPNKWNDIR